MWARCEQCDVMICEARIRLTDFILALLPIGHSWTPQPRERELLNMHADQYHGGMGFPAVMSRKGFVWK